MDDKLTFKDHINSMAKLANSRVFLLLKLKRLSYFKPELEMLYMSLVVPIITYGCSVWGCASGHLLDKIDEVQKKAQCLYLISDFKPIRDYIRESDAKLFHMILSILSEGKGHPLFRYLTERTK